MLQQEKKTDYNSVIGFALIGVIIFWFYQDSLEQAELVATTEEVVSQNEAIKTVETESIIALTAFESDSLVSSQLQDAYGAFANAASKEDLSEKFYLENDLVKVEVAAKGARVTSVFLKDYQTHDSLPVNLLREDSSLFNLTFWSQTRRLQTSNFVFETIESQMGEKQVLSMRLNVQEGKYFEFTYSLEPNSYKVDFNVNLVGLDDLIQSQTPLELDWSVNVPRQEKNRDNEAMNTSAYYFIDGEVDYLSSTSS